MQPGYTSPIPKRYQWRAWAADPEGMTGEELLAFTDDDLFPALKNLRMTGPHSHRRRVVRAVFEDAHNYMKSGQLMLPAPRARPRESLRVHGRGRKSTVAAEAAPDSRPPTRLPRPRAALSNHRARWCGSRTGDGRDRESPREARPARSKRARFPESGTRSSRVSHRRRHATGFGSVAISTAVFRTLVATTPQRLVDFFLEHYCCFLH